MHDLVAGAIGIQREDRAIAAAATLLRRAKQGRAGVNQAGVRCLTVGARKRVNNLEAGAGGVDREDRAIIRTSAQVGRSIQGRADGRRSRRCWGSGRQPTRPKTNARPGSPCLPS